MSGIKDLTELVRNMTPVLNEGEFVFTQVDNLSLVDREFTVFEFKETEGTTIVIERCKADELGLNYNYIASWITLKVNSSLEAIGLTAVFSTELSKYDISCNVVAGYSHDHIFVSKNTAQKAIKVLHELSENYCNKID